MQKANTDKTDHEIPPQTNRFIRPLLLLILALTVIGAASVLTQRYLWHAWLPVHAYRSQELGFELRVPTDWEAHEASEYQQVAFAPAGKGSGKEQPLPGIAILRNQPTENETAATADQYFSQLESTLDQTLAGQDEPSDTTLERYREVSRERRPIGKHQALVVRVAIDNFAHQTNVTGKGTIAYIYVSRQRQYVLTATASTADLAFIAQQERILLTFRTLE